MLPQSNVALSLEEMRHHSDGNCTQEGHAMKGCVQKLLSMFFYHNT